MAVEPAHKDTNAVPRLSDGRTLHLGVKNGQVANRIISVGSSVRAKTLSQHFDADSEVSVIQFNRGFTIYTGNIRGTLVSIVATGMGIANMDFVVRECRAVVKGPMAIIRFGTCGALHHSLEPGSLCIASPGSVFIARNPDAFHTTDNNKEPQYRLTKVPVSSDPALSQALRSSFETHESDFVIHERLNVTACSFYSSQGRHDPSFRDLNTSVVDQVKSEYPEVGTMEMETFHLLDLARCSDQSQPIVATAIVMIVANRILNQVVDSRTIATLEHEGGKIIMDTIAQYPLL